MNILQQAQSAVNKLVGLEVIRIFQAGDMTCFVFGERREQEQSSGWSLHVLQGWRLEHKGKTVTGTYDHFRHESPQHQPDEWDPSFGNTYLERVLRNILKDMSSTRQKTSAIVNRTSGFVLSAGTVAPNGDCTLYFQNEYVIQLLPLAGTGEAWVVFQHDNSADGFSMYLDDLA